MTEKERITTILWNCDGIPFEKCQKAADALVARGYRRHTEGAWIEENKLEKSAKFVCSVCEKVAYYPQPTRDKDWQKHCPYKYCPNCGAQIKGGLERVGTRAEVASEIFEEIEEEINAAWRVFDGFVDDLKKKFTMQ